MKYILLSVCIIITIVSCTGSKNYEVAPDIYILDKNEPVVSFEDLANRFRGKPIFIDRWATWCSPCVEEFKYNEDLYKFLDDKGIKIVYLNSDTDLEETAWFDFIIAHNLRGYHLRLDSLLKADLIDKGIFIPMIPQYMIVNREGEVVTNKANRPSEGIKLYMQLDSLLNK